MRLFTGLFGGSLLIAGAALLAFTGVTPDTMTVPAFTVELPTTFNGFLPETFAFSGFVMSNPFLSFQDWWAPNGLSHRWFLLLATLGWLGIAVGSVCFATFVVSLVENPYRRPISYTPRKKGYGQRPVIDWG